MAAVFFYQPAAVALSRSDFIYSFLNLASLASQPTLCYAYEADKAKLQTCSAETRVLGKQWRLQW